MAVPGSKSVAVCDDVVVLLIQVSLGMAATDVAPTRLDAAQRAGKAFADSLPPKTQLGLISFSATAVTQVAPTTDRGSVKTALDRLMLNAGNATGEGILTAVQAIDALRDIGLAPGSKRIILVQGSRQSVPAGLDDPRGAYPAAREANLRHIPISAIALGTAQGKIEIEPDNGGPTPVPVPVDQTSLREIAKLSGGSFHTATNLAELTGAFAELTCHR
ncbi:VWA domain-containing protein [Actinocrispum wychmicini]|uniref:von Willebrand factor type A domain-containing protein n=1 Tax=Actinocrispum wychmicini TaxID=1213861 RepID=A0A4R2JM49_9PSEU|nr:VWA domain-containing protein [Actinocrispum wychmicini]TCO58186.1 von Willebrand factor type A domain-containing protein [Actinocrispum wychmicini]